jgi:hypothetical protein
MQESTLLHRYRAWVGSAVRTGRPRFEIAFQVGLSLEELHLNFAADMQHASLDFKARVYQTLANQAVSGKYPSATIFWMKQFYLPKSVSKNSPKSNRSSGKETYATQPPPPGSIIVHGPNGERKP